MIDVPIQDRSWQITIYDILTLDIPQGNYSAHYDIDTKYLGITEDHGSGALYYPVLSLLKSKWSILQHHHTFSAISKPTILYSSLICKEHCGYYLKCSLQIQKASNTNLPTQIAPDVWILTTPHAAPVNTMTLICPEKAMETIIIPKPVHILKLPTPTVPPHPTSTYHLDMKLPTLDVNISLNMANLHMINIFGTGFLHMETSWKQQKWCATTAPNNHTLNSSTQNLPAPTQ